MEAEYDYFQRCNRPRNISVALTFSLHRKGYEINVSNFFQEIQFPLPLQYWMYCSDLEIGVQSIF